MIPIIETAGDVKLFKFLYIPYNKELDKEEFYGDYVWDAKYIHEGYLIVWSYTYNKYTRDSTDENDAHADVIDELPYELHKIWRNSDDCAWGKTDFYRDEIRFYISNDRISDDIVDEIKKEIGYRDDITEATNCSSVSGGHIGSIDIIGTPTPVYPDLRFDLDLYKDDDEE